MSTHPTDAVLSDDAVAALSRWWSWWWAVDRISASLWLIGTVRLLELDSILLTSEETLTILVVAVVPLIPWSITVVPLIASLIIRR